MPNELLQELNAFMVAVRSNPPQEKLYDFLQELSADGKLFGYSEQDWIEAGQAYDMTDDDIAEWIETAASWIEDTTDEGQYDPEPAFWTDSGQPKQNPMVRYGKGTEIEDCVCEETCNCNPCPCDKCEECEFCLCCCTCESPDEDEDDDYDGGSEEE